MNASTPDPKASNADDSQSDGISVQFLDDEAETGVVVACQSSHPGGMLAPLVKRLTNLELEVHQIESRLSDGVRSERLLVATPDGQPLSQRRQELLRTAVLTTMESMARGAANKNVGEPTELPELNAG